MLLINKSLLVRQTGVAAITKDFYNVVISKGWFKKEYKKKHTLRIQISDGTEYGHSFSTTFTSEKERDQEFAILQEKLREQQ